MPARADTSKGSPALPMSVDEVAEKFSECAVFAGWPAPRTARLVELIARLEELDDVRTLTSLLQPGA